MARNKRSVKNVRFSHSELKKRRGQTNWARMIQESSDEKQKELSKGEKVKKRLGPASDGVRWSVNSQSQ